MTSQHTIQHSPRRRLRRLLWASGTLLLTLATFAALSSSRAPSPPTAPSTSRSPPHRCTRPGPRTRTREPPGSVTVRPRPPARGRVRRRARPAPSPATCSRRTTSSPARPRSPPTSSPHAPAPRRSKAARPSSRRTRSRDVDADPALQPDLVVVPGLTKPTGSHRGGAAQLGDPPARRAARRSSACAAVHSSSPTPGCSTGCTPPATGPGSTRSRPAVRPCTGCAAAGRSRTGPSPLPPPSPPVSRPRCTSSPSSPGPPKRNASRTCTPSSAGPPPSRPPSPRTTSLLRDWPVGLNYVEPWFRPTVGIALDDGVGELDATAAFEVYGQSAAARTVALATGDTVRTRHGLTLLTTSTSHRPPTCPVSSSPAHRHADAVDATTARVGAQQGTHRRTAGRPRRRGRVSAAAGSRAALQNLADHTDAATTPHDRQDDRLPDHRPHLHSGHRSWRTVLLVLASLALAVLIGRAPARLARRRRRRSGTVGQHPRHQANSGLDDRSGPVSERQRLNPRRRPGATAVACGRTRSTNARTARMRQCPPRGHSTGYTRPPVPHHRHAQPPRSIQR